MKVSELFADKETKNSANQFAQQCLLANLDFDEQRFKDLYDAFIAGAVWQRLRDNN